VSGARGAFDEACIAASPLCETTFCGAIAILYRGAGAVKIWHLSAPPHKVDTILLQN
jgi:hypothetical protein